jgi:hypothetical protein
LGGETICDGEAVEEAAEREVQNASLKLDYHNNIRPPSPCYIKIIFLNKSIKKKKNTLWEMFSDT